MADKAIVLIVPEELAGQADHIARLIASTLTLNGYGHNTPSVIDWPDADAEHRRYDSAEFDHQLTDDEKAQA